MQASSKANKKHEAHAEHESRATGLGGEYPSRVTRASRSPPAVRLKAQKIAPVLQATLCLREQYSQLMQAKHVFASISGWLFALVSFAANGPFDVNTSVFSQQQSLTLCIPTGHT